MFEVLLLIVLDVLKSVFFLVVDVFNFVNGNVLYVFVLFVGGVGDGVGVELLFGKGVCEVVDDEEELYLFSEVSVSKISNKWNICIFYWCWRKKGFIFGF